MKKVFVTIVTLILVSATYMSCTPEALTKEDETEIFTVDPSNDGQVEEVDEERRDTED